MNTSFEARAGALLMYGAELRWLAIFKLVTLCLSAKVVMEHLCISRSTLKRWAARYAETTMCTSVRHELGARGR